MNSFPNAADLFIIDLSVFYLKYITLQPLQFVQHCYNCVETAVECMCECCLDGKPEIKHIPKEIVLTFSGEVRVPPAVQVELNQESK